DGAGGRALPHLHDPVFRVLHLHAVLLSSRKDEARADEGDAVRIAAAALLLGLGLTGASLAQEEAASLQAANTNIKNVASLQRGAKYYVNYCLGCHSAKYVRYNRLAADLGITEKQLVDNLMFTGEHPYDTMAIAMKPEDATRWFGVAPPDLSLIARSRGT